MSFIIDILILSIIAFTVFKGARRGFVKSVMSLASLIIAFIIANIYSPAMSLWYYNKFILSSVTEKISSFISGFIPVGSDTLNMSKLFGEGTFVEMLERYGADNEKLQAAYGSVTDATTAKIEELSASIAQPVASTISDALAFASIFFGALIILWVVTIIINMVFKLPVLRTANKVLGIVFGVVCALLYSWIFAIVAVWAINALGAVEPEMFGPSVVDNSVLLKFFNANNPLRLMFFN